MSENGVTNPSNKLEWFTFSHFTIQLILYEELWGSEGWNYVGVDHCRTFHHPIGFVW